MSLPAIDNPYIQILNLAGSGLNSGHVYIGLSGQDPQTNPQPVYWDAAGTIAAAQPLDVQGGYVMRAGTPAKAFTASPYSMQVRDRNDVQVWYNPSVSALSSADIGFIQAGTGAVERTAQDKMRETVSPEDFGALGNDVADDTAALQNALNTGLSVRLGVNKVYRYTDLTVPSGGGFVAVAPGIGVLKCSTAAGKINVTSASRFTNVRFDNAVGRTTYNFDVQGNETFFEECEFVNYFQAARIGTTGGLLAVLVGFTACNFFSPHIAAGSGAVQFENFGNCFFNNCSVNGPASGTQPDFGIRLLNGDTFYCIGSNLTHHGKALLMDVQNAQNVYAARFVGSLFDSAGTITGGATVNCAELIPAAGGGIYSTEFASCWFGLATGKSGAYVDGQAGIVDGLDFTAPQFLGNGVDGLTVVGINAKNWSVTGGRSGGNVNGAGIRADVLTPNFTITGHRAGNVAGYAGNLFGISVAATASDGYVIVGNNLRGNVTAPLADNGTGTNKTVANNQLT